MELPTLPQLHRSRADHETEGGTLYIRPQDLVAIRPAQELLEPTKPIFGLSPRQIGRSVSAAARAAGLGDGFTSHSGRVGMAQDLAKTGAEFPALMAAGR